MKVFRGQQFGVLSRGFTLIELVMVTVILGLLAAYAGPRIFDTQIFNSRGLYDQTLALLRYAQKTAIAQRRTVCVAFTATSATLSMASIASTSGCATATALSGPRGEVPAAVAARGNVTYSLTPAVLNFNGLGQPVDNTGNALTVVQTVRVGNGPADITIQPVTGYVQ